ncbi:MAG: hypothetical protein LBD37_10005 [Treponema sp.]|nr:hypothetical protein [Treponema sp.]
MQKPVIFALALAVFRLMAAKHAFLKVAVAKLQLPLPYTAETPSPPGRKGQAGRLCFRLLIFPETVYIYPSNPCKNPTHFKSVLRSVHFFNILLSKKLAPKSLLTRN